MCTMTKNIQFSTRLGRRVLSSDDIRNRFLDFFKSKDHLCIKSSSVQPYADSSLEFVNAGMNQFKNTFLGLYEPTMKRSVNSQKCVRVGGKHNDLDVVGHDSYHHTFFEMLGNWSFGDYFKEDACAYALELVTSPPYSLPLERLYFTYFKGDKLLNLPPDLETKQIWQKLGVSEERIIGFGLNDNFWEMGTTGPCGPCTEIHYDHLGSDPRPNSVNAGLSDLTELWNIVFIHYNRQADGSLNELSQSFVDTGMGLERLTALLQGHSSNYDTDLFTPLFNTISKTAQIPHYKGRYGKDDLDHLDTRYRILADHSRMIAVTLSDYILPDYSHSLRRVIRKSLLVGDSLASNLGLPLLLNTVASVADTLKNNFPQIKDNFKLMENILRDEETLFKEVRQDTQNEWNKLLEHDSRLESLTDCQSIGLIEAYNYLNPNKEQVTKKLDVNTTLICYDRYGLNISLIEQLANIKGYTIDKDEFNKAVDKLKEINKSLISNTIKLNRSNISEFSDSKHTCDKYKFVYSRDSKSKSYSTDSLNTHVLKGWIDDTKFLKEGQQILYGSNMSLLLSSTNFSAPLNGNDKPLGQIILTGPTGNQAHFTVLEVQRMFGWILHKGFIVPLSKRRGDPIVYENWSAECHVDTESTESLMRNNTSSLLLDSVMSSKYQSVMTFLNYKIDSFIAKFHLYGQNFSIGDALDCEDSINALINKDINFDVKIIHHTDLLSNNSITLPPHINPYLTYYQHLTSNESIRLRVVTSTPNVLNSGDLNELCLTQFHLGKRGRECTLGGVVGPGIKRKLFESTLDLIDTLNSPNPKVESHNLIKFAKGQLSNLKIPLELHGSLKNAMNQSRAPKSTKMRS